MSINEKWDILFIAENESMFDSNTPMFDQLFNKVDKVFDADEAVRLADNNNYDVIISDISVEFVDGIRLLKLINSRKAGQAIYALVTPKDSDRLFGISEQGIHAFELEPTQFDLALETIAGMNPNLKK